MPADAYLYTTFSVSTTPFAEISEEVAIYIDPYSLPNPLILLSMLAFAVVAVPALGGYGLAVLIRGRRRRDRVLRGLAAMAAAAAIFVYGWGALAMLQDESSASAACKQAVGPTYAGTVDGYETSFVPLSFGCRVDGVGVYEAFVPGFVNPTALVLVLVTVALIVLARRSSP